MILRKLFLAIGLLGCSTLTQAQSNVSNIRIQQQDSILCVFYDLKGGKADISLYFSRDNGKTFIGPLTNIEGDAGTGITQGASKLILWNVVKEMGYIDIDNAKVKVVAHLIKESREVWKPKRFSLAMLGASINNNQHSYSLMYGQVKRWGWYGKIKTDFNFNLSNDNTYNIYLLGGAFFNGEKSDGRLAVTAGTIWNIARPVMLYAGLGYGRRWVDWGTIGNQKVRIDDYSYQGIEVEIGAILHINRFLLSAGVCLNTFAIDYWETDLSIGFTF